MATRCARQLNGICTGHLFHPKRIYVPRLSHPKRDINIRTALLDAVKSIKSSKTLKLAAGATLGIFLYGCLERDASFRNQFNFIADVVEAAADAVVHVTVREKGLFPSTKGGSGFIIKSDGLIITNAHVVGNKYGKDVQITLRNGKTFVGVVNDIDEGDDLAMLKINGSNLPVLNLGSGYDLRPGEWVVAIGSPLFLANSVTAGVVSSVHRKAAEIGHPNRNNNYIQTDAQGNSGGPLVNLDGKVVGVNTMTLMPGISFAIPAENVKKFMERYNRKAKTVSSKYYLGLSYIALDSVNRRQILSVVQLPEHIKNGMYVWKVEPNSPAFASGLQSGDVIFEVEGDPVYDIWSLVAKFNAKNTVSVKIYRKGMYFSTNLIPKKRSGSHSL